MRIVNDCNVDDHLTALDKRWWSLFSVPSSPWSEMKGLRYVIALFHVALIARANIQNTIAVIIIVTVLTIASTLKTSTMVWPRLRMIDIFRFQMDIGLSAAKPGCLLWDQRFPSFSHQRDSGLLGASLFPPTPPSPSPPCPPSLPHPSSAHTTTPPYPPPSPPHTTGHPARSPSPSRPSILVPDLIGFLSTLTFSVCFFCTFPFFFPTLLIAFLTHILIILIWLLHCWSGSVAPPLCKLFIFFHIFTFTKSIFFRTLSPPWPFFHIWPYSPLKLPEHLFPNTFPIIWQLSLKHF